MAMVAGLGLLYTFLLKDIMQIGFYVWICAFVFAAAAAASCLYLQNGGAERFEKL
jgi:hypothetical protein